MNQAQFGSAVLRRLGIKPTRANLKMMTGWMAAEGGHWNNSAKFNPLNTTQPMDGAGNTGSQGNIKVYKSWQQGVDATVKTIQNGRYAGIIQSLHGKDPSKFVQALGNSPWGTNASLVAKTVGAAPGVTPAAPSPTSAAGAPRARVSAAAMPVQDNSAFRQQLALGMLQRHKTGASLIDVVKAAQESAGAALGLTDTSQKPARSVPSGTPAKVEQGKGAGRILELFYDPLGGWDNGKSIGAIGGHSDHVHVGALTARKNFLKGVARRYGLTITSEHGGKHAPGSLHYRDEAFDAAGSPEQMRAFAEHIRKKYGLA